MSVNLKICTWNIDGLDEANIEDRVVSICSMLVSLDPDVILLQEVTLSILDQIVILFKAMGYMNMENSRPRVPYFTMIIARNEVVARGYRRRDFAGIESKSLMCRDISSVKIPYDGGDILIITSHLESCKESSARRCAQLAECFQEMNAHDGPVIFGGDLNLRDAEAKKTLKTAKGKEMKIIDCWEAMGSDCKHRFTWFLPGNPSVHARFDRFFFNCHQDVNLASFRLFADESAMNSGGSSVSTRSNIPLSDHCGLMLEFSVLGGFICRGNSSGGVSAAAAAAAEIDLEDDTNYVPTSMRTKRSTTSSPCVDMIVCVDGADGSRVDGNKRARMLGAALQRMSQQSSSTCPPVSETTNSSIYSNESRSDILFPLVCPDAVDREVFSMLPREMQEEIVREEGGSW
jgi:endonuclease/exonuclease/phosphatase family metal-dependent hydrolase